MDFVIFVANHLLSCGHDNQASGSTRPVPSMDLPKQRKEKKLNELEGDEGDFVGQSDCQGRSASTIRATRT